VAQVSKCMSVSEDVDDGKGDGMKRIGWEGKVRWTYSWAGRQAAGRFAGSAAAWPGRAAGVRRAVRGTWLIAGLAKDASG
jgi:hypothetical protein